MATEIFFNSGYDHIFRDICSRLTSHELLRLSATCKILHGRVIESEWDLDRSLLEFTPNPSELRHIMRNCDAVISGCFALRFLARGSRNVGNLALYVQRSERTDELRRFFLREGYHQGTTITEKGYYDLVKLERNSDSNLPPTVVSFISTNNLPVDFIIQNSYSTAIVNFIFAGRAVSVYPKVTFDTHGDVQLRVQIPNHKPSFSALLEYHRRGWPLVPFDESVGCLGQIRSFGDRYCWTLPLSQEGICTRNSFDILRYSTLKRFVICDYLVMYIRGRYKPDPNWLCRYF